MPNDVKLEQFSGAVEKTAAILKRKFNNLTVEETIKLSTEIVIAVVREVGNGE